MKVKRKDMERISKAMSDAFWLKAEDSGEGIYALDAENAVGNELGECLDLLTELLGGVSCG